MNKLTFAIDLAKDLLTQHSQEDFVSKADAKKAVELLNESFNPTVQLAVETLTKALKEDPEYYYGWQANIAMQVQDEYTRKWGNETPVDIHAISNEAAKRFLDLLIGQ